MSSLRIDSREYPSMTKKASPNCYLGVNEMPVKPHLLTFILFVAALSVIVMSTLVLQWSPNTSQGVRLSPLGFAAILLVVAVIGMWKAT
jgi:hypothetical protein